jgi:hypothetical protein
MTGPYTALVLDVDSVASVKVASRGGVLGTSAREPLRRHGSVMPTTQNASSETT